MGPFTRAAARGCRVGLERSVFPVETSPQISTTDRTHSGDKSSQVEVKEVFSFIISAHSLPPLLSTFDRLPFDCLLFMYLLDLPCLALT